ncbi:MAG: hypothetical protein AB7E13_11170 [Arcobacteraceae bacterium]
MKKEVCGGSMVMWRILVCDVLFFLTKNRDYLRLKKELLELQIQEVDSTLLDLRSYKL